MAAKPGDAPRRYARARPEERRLCADERTVAFGSQSPTVVRLAKKLSDANGRQTLSGCQGQRSPARGKRPPQAMRRCELTYALSTITRAFWPMAEVIRDIRLGANCHPACWPS
jgi:hypothetical protein